MHGISVGLYALAYVLAVVDGTRAEKGTFPSSPGRTGLRRDTRQHPWIVTGAVCGLAGLAIDFI